MSRDSIRNKNCTLCELHKSAQHVCLMGSGPEDAEVMVIGEAPGEREDASHQAFVGRSGKLLDRALSELARIPREKCYVTNVVKCRPPDNKTPGKIQLRTCSSHYLMEEIEMVRPKFMLLLGNIPLQAILGRSGITKYHGMAQVKEVVPGLTVTIMPSLHPAAILRNPKWAQTFAADFDRFGRLTRGEPTGLDTVTKVARTPDALDALITQLMKVPEICFDIETYVAPDPRGEPYERENFQDWHGDDSRIASISFTWEIGYSVVVPLWHKTNPWPNPQEVLDRLRPALERTDCTYIAHNGKFDCRWLRSKGIKIPLTFDTMLAAHMIDENRPKSLKDLSPTLLGADPYGVGEELQDATQMDLKRLCEYNAKDTDYTYRLKGILESQLLQDERSHRVFTTLMMPASNALTEIEAEGVWIDPERWEGREEEARENLAKIVEYIQRYVPEDFNAGKKKDEAFNPRSPQQVGRLLFEVLGLPVISETKTGAPSTAEDVLLRLQHKHKVCLAIMKYRKWRKFLDTYLWPWKYKHGDKQGRAHSTYKLYGTVTGRLSGEGGIQQVPRDPFIRSIVGAPPGWRFVQADYSQIELRIAAMIANERNMISQFSRGDDIHMLRAMKMTGKPADRVEKEERKKAKAVNFGYIYSMGPSKFVEYCFTNYGLTISFEEAEADRRSFFEDYPGLSGWHDRQRRLARRYHRVVSPIGRVRHLPDILSRDEGVRSEAERQAINSPVQSCASDFMLFSLITLHGKLPRKECRILGTVHDSILFEIREDKVDKYCPIIKATMEDVKALEKAFSGLQITVPIVADIEVGTHWGEGEPWERKR